MEFHYVMAYHWAVRPVKGRDKETSPPLWGPRRKEFLMGNLEICFLMDLEKGRFLEKASRKKKDGKSGEWRWVSLGEEMATFGDVVYM